MKINECVFTFEIVKESRTKTKIFLVICYNNDKLNKYDIILNEYIQHGCIIGYGNTQEVYILISGYCLEL
jgi:hypothetical protein